MNTGDSIINSDKVLTVYKVDKYKTIWFIDESGEIRKTSYARAIKGSFLWKNLKVVQKPPIKYKFDENINSLEKTSGYPTKPGIYYVYGAYHKGKLIYIGSGKDDRYKHCTSGTSHNLELNRLFFANEYVYVEKLQEGLTKPESLKVEKELIKSLLPTLNIAGKPKT